MAPGNAGPVWMVGGTAICAGGLWRPLPALLSVRTVISYSHERGRVFRSRHDGLSTNSDPVTYFLDLIRLSVRLSQPETMCQVDWQNWFHFKETSFTLCRFRAFHSA